MIRPDRALEVIAGGRAELERAALRALVRRDGPAFEALLKRLTPCSNSVLRVVANGRPKGTNSGPPDGAVPPP
jgi:hypothetical protein